MLKLNTRLSQEERIIRCLFKDKLIQTRSSSYIDPNLFDNLENRSIITGIISFMTKYGTFPSPADMGIGIPEDSPVRTQFDKILDNNVDDDVNEENQIDSIETFFKKQKTKRILEKHAEAIFNGKITEVLPQLLEDLTGAVNFSINTKTALSMLKDIERILEELNRPDTAIPSSLNQLRYHTGGDKDPSAGGWYRKAVSAFMGMPNIGKTIFLCNEAAFAYRCGYNVMYITLEMHEELIYKRIMANVAQLDQSDIKDQDHRNLKSLLEKHVLHNNDKQGDVYCKQLDTNTSAAEIENAILECERVHDTSIDFLVVDYLGIMKPTNNNKNANTYQIGKDVAEQLRDVASRRDIAILTATQTNRSGYDDTNVTMANTSESSGINATLDFLITITQDEFLRRERIFSNTIIKNRFGSKDITIFTKCDFLRMTLSDASEGDLEAYYSTLASTDQVVDGFNKEASAIIPVPIKKEVPKLKPNKPQKISSSNSASIVNVNNNKPNDIIPPGYVSNKVEKVHNEKNIINRNGTIPQQQPNIPLPVDDGIF